MLISAMVHHRQYVNGNGMGWDGMGCVVCQLVNDLCNLPHLRLQLLCGDNQPCTPDCLCPTATHFCSQLNSCKVRWHLGRVGQEGRQHLGLAALRVDGNGDQVAEEPANALTPYPHPTYTQILSANCLPACRSSLRYWPAALATTSVQAGCALGHRAPWCARCPMEVAALQTRSAPWAGAMAAHAGYVRLL